MKLLRNSNCVPFLQATQSLVNAIKFEADGEGDPEARKRLLDAAKALADATSKMVEAAKVSIPEWVSMCYVYVCYSYTMAARALTNFTMRVRRARVCLRQSIP